MIGIGVIVILFIGNIFFGSMVDLVLGIVEWF